MANQKDRGGDKEAFLIMAGAYALAFRAETGRKPESNDRPLTPSQNLPLWIHIFSRLSKDGSTLEKAMSVAEKNVARAGLTGSHSITDVLSVNIAVVRDPLLEITSPVTGSGFRIFSITRDTASYRGGTMRMAMIAPIKVHTVVAKVTYRRAHKIRKN